MELTKNEELIWKNNDALTCAVSVGVSRYESYAIPDLQFSDSDAHSFANLLKEYGVDDVAILTNKDATRKNILDCIGKSIPLRFNSVTGSKRLIVFFSGHGCRLEIRGALPKSVLLTYDTDTANIGVSGISLQDLIDVISRSDPDEVFIFIDACSAQFENLPNIFTPASTEAEVFTNARAKHLFVYVASAQKAAYEDVMLEAGVFTECLIRNIRSIQNSGGNISELTTAIHNEINSTGKQNPLYYSIGNMETWIFDNQRIAQSTSVDLSLRKGLYVDRAKLYVSLLSVIKSKNTPIFVFGESGVGKSTLVRQMLSEEFDGVYLSIPDADEVSVQSIVSDLVYQTVNVFPSGRPLESVNATLEYYKENSSNELIIIDHTERNQTLTQALFEKFTEFSLKVVFVGRKVNIPLSNCITWECPKLSLAEVTKFIDDLGLLQHNDPVKIFNRCNGLPIQLIGMLNSQESGIENISDKNHCIDALSATGGFIDEHIFKTVFSIKSLTLDQFISTGKITVIEDRFIPHDSIINIKHKINSDVIFNYWKQQVKKTPTHSWACKQLVTIILKDGNIKSLHEKSSDSLLLAINRLFESKEWDLLKLLSKHLIKRYPEQHDVLLLLAKIFVHRSNYIVVDEIMDCLKEVKLSTDQKNLKLTIEAEKLWWIGEYEQSKKICSILLAQPISEQLVYECKMHMGVADFFLGNWKEALEALSFAKDILNSASPQVNAWALYIGATIIGLRGTDIRKGKEQFYAGIRLLEQIGDDSGTASAWGNLAEMTWKLRDYESALAQANRGYNIAKQTDHVIDQIEITRNILHISFRLYSPFDPKVENAKILIENLIQDDIGETVDMQVWNTLATLYAYRGDQKNLKIMIDKAFPHTCNNREYHIYTLANLCLYGILSGDIENTLKYYLKAYHKAMKGSNILAIRQMNDDIDYLNKNYHSYVSTVISHHIKPIVNKVESQIKIQLKENFYENFN